MELANARSRPERRWRRLAGAAALLLGLTAASGHAPAQTAAPAEEHRPRVTISFEPISEDVERPATAQTPVVPPGCTGYPLDLATALALAGAENPTIALAQEAVRASRAEELRAQALLLPTLDAGTSLDVHRGNLQTSQGQIIHVDRQSLYVGAGASAVGAGTVTIPGVRLTAQVADAVFEPRAAREQVVASNFDALATRNRVLLDVTDRYFALVGAEGSLQAFRQSEADLGQLVDLTANFARTGEGREGDANRARSDALLLHTAEQRAEEDVAVTAAELARLLNMDPAVRLRGPGGLPPVVQLVDPRGGLEPLVQIALRNRPEIAARTADVAVVATHLRQEQVRPLVPLLSVGYSAGAFGGGSNRADTSFGHFNGRADFDALAVWSLENFGLGNLAIQRRLRAAVAEAEAERARVIDRVRREVADGYALSLSRSRELDLARRRVEIAQEGYRLDLIRIRNLAGTRLKERAYPIEALNNFRLLNAARQDLVRALVGFDQSQFQLFVALGQPPTLAAAGDPACR
jgi:outer membrane protein TolC